VFSQVHGGESTALTRYRRGRSQFLQGTFIEILGSDAGNGLDGFCMGRHNIESFMRSRLDDQNHVSTYGG